MCQVVAYGRLKTIENFKQSSLKVVAYERWSPTRDSIYSDFDLKTFGILEKWSLMRGGRLREVVAKGGSTVSLHAVWRTILARYFVYSFPCMIVWCNKNLKIISCDHVKK